MAKGSWNESATWRGMRAQLYHAQLYHLKTRQTIDKRCQYLTYNQRTCVCICVCDRFHASKGRAPTAGKGAVSPPCITSHRRTTYILHYISLHYTTYHLLTAPPGWRRARKGEVERFKKLVFPPCYIILYYTYDVCIYSAHMAVDEEVVGLAVELQ